MLGALYRRSFLKAIAALGACAASGKTHASSPGLRFGPAIPFSFDGLKEAARQLSRAPYRPPRAPAPEITALIDYDVWGQISCKADHALRVNDQARFPVEFFHLGALYPKAVTVHSVVNGEAREVLYDPNHFDTPENSIARRLPPMAGFGGVKIQEPIHEQLDWRKNDWVAFLGASYFRAIGALRQYGVSARGVALDTWQMGAQEEFPDFTQFYIGPETADGIYVHALLEGPSIAGAYRFLLTRGAGVVMDVDCALFLRRAVTRFGVAPLTSMYWFSETHKTASNDWRPEVHDSDGLAIWNGAGERLWRPLNNPAGVVASAFLDNNPKGFGLLQRDRVFDHYLDGVAYDRRPSVWVEPKGDWGKGAIQLIEIPTSDEAQDNIVAMWVPDEPATADAAFDFSYRLHWLADEPYPTPLARCVATRVGAGGRPGRARPRGVHKFVVEFRGAPLAQLGQGARPQPVLWASRGRFSDVIVEPADPDAPDHWRTLFDLIADGPDPVEIRLSLKNGDSALTEAWLFQHHLA